jgi:glycosyltransferase involved in cell wall biosynthesis
MEGLYMNILLILSDNVFPPDIRVRKETRALINAGHNIFLIARRGDNQNKKETVEGVHVYRIDYPFQTIPVIGGFLYFFIYRYFLLFYIVFMSRRYRIDALHVHDLPFALATCIAGKIIQKPVVFDMHEDYVEMVSWGMKGEKGVKKNIELLLSKTLKIEERIGIALSTKILVVVEEEIKRLNTMGIPSEKIEVISNTADLEELDNMCVSGSYTEFYNEFVISYIGGFSKHRGLDTLIEAMPLILNKIPNAHLLLVGDGVMKASLVRLCTELNIENNVTFTGWVPFEEAMRYIMISDICTIPYHKTRQTNKSFPHKLSQYMYLEKPILVSDVESLKRIIEETQCGIIFEAGNPYDLAKKTIKAKKKQGFLDELGMNGKKAAEKKYNWNNTSKKLVGLYYDQLTENTEK